MSARNAAAISQITDGLKAEARRLGFDAIGITPAVTPPGYPRFLEWLERGHAAGMSYLPDTAAARAHPSAILPGVRSIVMAVLVYGSPAELDAPGADTARIARYAQAGDYHELFWRRLETLLAWLERQWPGVQGRAVADTAPLMERDFARLAGLGWIGKNTLLIHPDRGSYTLLGALLVDCELAYDAPFEAEHCGTCTRCIDACPTDALIQPYELDAKRCLSYWTIEHRGPLPPEIAANLNGRVFGCDICQEVCPWNRSADAAVEPRLDPQPQWRGPDLMAWLEASPAEFAKAIKGTAMTRAKRSGLLRNALAILKYQPDSRTRDAIDALTTDADSEVRLAALEAREFLRGSCRERGAGDQDDLVDGAGVRVC